MNSLAIQRTAFPLLKIQDSRLLFEFNDYLPSFLSKNLPELVHIQLAHAHVEEDSVTFSVTSDGRTISFEPLHPDKHKELLGQYIKALESIDQFFKIYDATNEENLDSWSEIIGMALNPNFNQLFTDGTTIYVIWGFDFSSVNATLVNAINLFEYPFREKSVSDNAIQTNNAKDNTSSESPAENEETILIRNSNKIPHRSFLGYLGIGLRNLIKSGWLFLVLVLAFFAYLYTRECKECSVRIEPAENPKEIALKFLPPRERAIVPIDSNQIIIDEDSLHFVVDGRINVALKRKTDAFFPFISALGSHFIHGKRKIIYYDEETRRIQIEFDPKAEPNIADSIRNAVPEFPLLVWNETIFTNYLTDYNDPLTRNLKDTWHLNQLNMEKVWPITMGDTSITVAIIDNGFDLDHPDLKSVKRRDSYNVIRQNNEVYGTNSLDHGTHVASLVFATPNNNEGSIGIAPNVTFMPIQIGQEGVNGFVFTSVVDGILYALNHNADVINLSLGLYFNPFITRKSLSEQEEIIAKSGLDAEAFWQELFEMAEAQNVVIVQSAGNQHIISGLDPMKRHASSIVVGALNRSGELWEHSNFGPMVSVYAPGADILSAVPNQKYKSMSGTSMASPIVAGSIALYKSLNPDATNQDIRNKLSSSIGKRKRLNIETLLSK